MIAEIPLCPECKQPLRVNEAIHGGVWDAYCAYGPCESVAANKGAMGRSPDEAVKKLTIAVEAEQVRKAGG